ncbi:hypothetical protein Hanom_Chr02g00132491 [Helianthus anomalus]
MCTYCRFSGEAYHMKKILKYHGVCSDHCTEDCAWLKTRTDRTENQILENWTGSTGQYISPQF